jgi:hypothetical protein
MTITLLEITEVPDSLFVLHKDDKELRQGSKACFFATLTFSLDLCEIGESLDTLRVLRTRAHVTIATKAIMGILKYCGVD